MDKFNSIYISDYETTVYDGQEDTEVWLSGFCSLDGKNMCILYDLDSYMNTLFALPSNSKIYFHNMKFDGSFILDWLERNNFKKSLRRISKNSEDVRFNPTDKMYSKEYTCYISAKGQWYNIVIKKGRKIFHIYDSLKLLPFSLDKITKDFDVLHKKLTMQYKKYRKSGETPSPDEIEYFKHDLLGLAECLSIMFTNGLDGYTIGSCCLKYFKSLIGKYEFANLFPNIYEDRIECADGATTAGDFILKSYYGGFTYVNPDFKEKIVQNGKTLDCTSLYASIMHSKSGIKFPVGHGKYGRGYYKKFENYNPANYYFQRFRCCFRLKKGKLPFVKIRKNYLYNSRECLTSSDIVIEPCQVGDITVDTKCIIENQVELCYTQTELELFLDHYDVYNMEYLDYIEFHSISGIFDEYINTWFQQKSHAKTPVERTIAKLMLVNLYGKFCTKKLSSFKVPYYNPDKDAISFYEQSASDNTPGHIAMGSAIISEARCFHIKNCQKAHDKGIFCYSDTDSMHICGEIPEGIEFRFADNELLTYKLESEWKEGWFQHPKRYIEKIKNKDGSYSLSVTCAGLPDRGKDLLRCSMGDLDKKELGEISEAEKKFISRKRTYKDFTTGISIPGKLRVKRIKGGVILNESEFTIL